MATENSERATPAGLLDQFVQHAAMSAFVEVRGDAERLDRELRLLRFGNSPELQEQFFATRQIQALAFVEHVDAFSERQQFGDEIRRIDRR